MALSAGEVHVYAVELNCSATDLMRAQAWLSEEELGRMNSFHFPHLARRFAVSHAVLRMLLQLYTGLPGRTLELQSGQYGKPALPTNAEVHFNLSGSADLAALCLSRDGEVGIDVEQIRRLSDVRLLAESVLSKGEMGEVMSLPEEVQSLGFLRYWTLKEACLKAAGVGLSVDANRLDCRHGKVRWEKSSLQAFAVDDWTLHQFNPVPGYIGACVTTRGDARIRITQHSFESLAAEIKLV